MGTIACVPVSTWIMSLRESWRRTLSLTAVACSVLAVVLAYVPVQQQILRWRAECLLSDIREIQLGKSDWGDAQRLMRRWGAWGAYDGSCTAEQCIYRIAIQGGFPSHAYYHVLAENQPLPPLECCRWMNLPYAWLGGRSDIVIGEFLVRNQIVWGKRFEMMLDIPVVRNNPEGYEYELKGEATSVSRLPDHFGWMLRHPDIVVGTPGACHSCKAIYFRFTPYADPDQVRDAMNDFNLDCLIHRTHCFNQGDVMPDTWKRVEAERSLKHDEAMAELESCRFPLEELGRDSHYAAIAEVVSSKRVRGLETELRQSTTFRLTRQIKGSPFPHSGDLAEPVRPFSFFNGSQRENILRPGQSFILAFDGPMFKNDEFMLRIPDCGIIPLNEQNLASVERGIQQDVLPPDLEALWPR